MLSSSARLQHRYTHFLVEDHAASRAAQGLVGGCGDDVGVFKGGGDGAGSNETGNMGHVCEHDGADAEKRGVKQQTKVTKGRERVELSGGR